MAGVECGVWPAGALAVLAVGVAGAAAVTVRRRAPGGPASGGGV
ncbi:hypothetical protein [Nonomuraea longicatena]